MTITYIAPEWPMLCRSCHKDMGYFVPGLPAEKHKCDDCCAKETAAVIGASMRKALGP
jgi:hypothetical protein